MEKEQILSTLTEKIGQTSLSSRTLSTYVDNNLPVEGTEPDDAYWTKHVSVLQALGGQYNHDIAEYVKAHPTEQEHGGNGNAEEIAKLQAQIDKLNEAHKADESARNLREIRLGLIGKADELKVRNKAMWEDAINGLTFAEGATDADRLKAAKEAYESLQNRYIGSGATPYGTSSDQQGGNDEERKKKRNAYLESLRNSGKLPKASE